MRLSYTTDSTRFTNRKSKYLQNFVYLFLFFNELHKRILTGNNVDTIKRLGKKCMRASQKQTVVKHYKTNF